MRVGIFGGTFDPPHAGHRILANDVIESLGLTRLVVVPAGQQPLKTNNPATATPAQRLHMVKLAFAGDPRIEITDTEITRPGLSFTVDTLEIFRNEYAGAELVLIIGRDSWNALGSWREPERICRLARIAVLERTSQDRSVPQNLRSAGGDAPFTQPEPLFVTTRRIDVSATEIRRRLKNRMSVGGFVAESVERYIATEKLYT